MMPQSTSVTSTTYSSGSYTASGTMWGATDADLNAEIIDEAEDANSLGKDEFMKLLLAQMQNQDPLNPTDNTEFVAQLAQFSSLEQMTNMNTSLEEMITSNAVIADSINNTMLVSYIGKDVDAVSNYFNYDGSSPVTLTFYAENDISGGELEIMDSSGTLIRTIEFGDLFSGKNEITWDGLTSGGNYPDSGGYYYNIEAYDVSGESVSLTPRFDGTVDGISYVDGIAYLKFGDIMVQFDSVISINNPETVEE